MKKLFIILLFLVSMNSSLFSQDFNVNPHRYYQSSFYYGLPLFYEGGYGYQKKDFQLVLPYVGVKMNPISGIDVYGGFKLLYKTFKFEAKVKHEVYRFGDSFGASYADSTSTVGVFVLGYAFDAMYISATTEVGSSPFTNVINQQESLEKGLVIKQNLQVRGSVYNNSITQISSENFLKFMFIPHKNVATFSIETYLPMIFRQGYGWFEIGIMPSIEYKDYITRGDRDFSFSTSPRAYDTKMALGDSSLIPNYQFSVALDIDLRFYLKFLQNISAGLSRLYINFNVVTGYGKEFDQSLNQGEFYYLYGGGIGYNIFDGAAMSLNVHADNNGELFLSFISSILISP